jgi:hypothetical protein
VTLGSILCPRVGRPKNDLGSNVQQQRCVDPVTIEMGFADGELSGATDLVSKDPIGSILARCLVMKFGPAFGVEINVLHWRDHIDQES